MEKNGKNGYHNLIYKSNPNRSNLFEQHFAAEMAHF